MINIVPINTKIKDIPKLTSKEVKQYNKAKLKEIAPTTKHIFKLIMIITFTLLITYQFRPFFDYLYSNTTSIVLTSICILFVSSVIGYLLVYIIRFIAYVFNRILTSDY